MTSIATLRSDEDDWEDLEHTDLPLARKRKFEGKDGADKIVHQFWLLDLCCT